MDRMDTRRGFLRFIPRRKMSTQSESRHLFRFARVAVLSMSQAKVYIDESRFTIFLIKHFYGK